MNAYQPKPPSEDRYAVFHPLSNVGFWRRLAAAVLDVLVLAVFLSASTGLFTFIIVGFQLSGAILLPILVLEAVVAVLYLTILKSSQTRTVGYRVFDCEVVAADGGVPSFRTMLTRLILWPIIHPSLNLFSISQHDSRQAISDMIAGTIVIRAGSEPIRFVRRTWSMYFFMNRTFLVSQAEL